MKAVLALTCLAVVALAQQDCPEVKPMDGFNYSKFTGRWYEIGHYRNAGPSIWSEDCFCSTSNVTQDELGLTDEDSIYTYDCNIESADGELQLYDTILSNMDPPGKWLMNHAANRPRNPHDLTVVSMTDDYALVYRCGDYEEFGISYTAQILSRKPTLDDEIVTKLQGSVGTLRLNPENADYVKVPHGNCTYEGH